YEDATIHQDVTVPWPGTTVPSGTDIDITPQNYEDATIHQDVTVPWPGTTVPPGTDIDITPQNYEDATIHQDVTVPWPGTTVPPGTDIDITPQNYEDATIHQDVTVPWPGTTVPPGTDIDITPQNYEDATIHQDVTVPWPGTTVPPGTDIDITPQNYEDATIHQDSIAPWPGTTVPPGTDIDITPQNYGDASTGHLDIGGISRNTETNSLQANQEGITPEQPNCIGPSVDVESAEANIEPDDDTYAVMSDKLETLYPVLSAPTQINNASNGDYAFTSGEVNYAAHGGKQTEKYEILSDSVDDVEMSLTTFKTRMAEKIKNEQGNSTAHFGSLGSPKTWNEAGTKGEIYYVDWSDGRHYFEAKQDGAPGQNKWYYPENNKDNTWWKIVHPIEYYAITSDPQYARTPNGVDQEEQAKPAIYNQYQVLNSLKSTYGDAFKGTIINGDITDFGHDWQWSEMKKALGTLNHDYWYGLGNHDYENNVNDCFTNNCAVRSIRELTNNLKSRKNINAIDYNVISGYSFPSLSTNYIGSFSYSFDMSGIRFIQLNNYAEYTKKFSGFSMKDARKYTVKVTPSVDWLEQQLADARKQGKAVILLSHIKNMGEANSRLQQMTAKNSDYDITAIFNGHTHEMSVGDYYANSGATFKETFLLVEVNNLKRELSIYEVSDNDLKTKKLEATIPLKLSVVDKTIKENAFRVTLKNGGGYIGVYKVKYVREDGSNATIDHRLALGNTVTVEVPRGAKNVQVIGKTKTGRSLYNVSLNDYKNVCIKSWGTLPKNLHWAYCG
ncbi:metallophosphoesterase, partial [Rahnella perminowiae]|uniref:metallophosphoesterase n=1 Tax=Rahnella perminowiae TaxID=2816244 RepID=UPI001C2779E2